MSRRYDTRTTIFSPQGRLFQVEYAIQAINHAGTCVGIVFDNGVILGSEKRNIDPLLDSFLPEKIYRVSDTILCTVAGVTSDASTLVNRMRVESERHYLMFQELITCEELVKSVCYLKQQYTQIGGYRPFGVSLLYAAWDKKEGFQLFQSDPSGNYSGWKATCIGKNNEDAITFLKTEYHDNLDLHQASKLLASVLKKTIDRSPLTSESLEVAYIHIVNGKLCQYMMQPQEIDQMLAL